MNWYSSINKLRLSESTSGVGHRKLAQGQKNISIPTTRLFGWQPKAKEAIKDIQEGRLSLNSGTPVVVSRLDNPRGSFFVLDGHHRILEAIMSGKTMIDAQIDLYTPRIERTGGGYESILSDKVRLSDMKLDQIAE